MPTKSPRVNVTFEPAIAAILARLAKERGQSVSGLARELVLEALERQEDMALSALAESRDVGKRKTVSHEAAWE